MMLNWMMNAFIIYAVRKWSLGIFRRWKNELMTLSVEFVKIFDY